MTITTRLLVLAALAGVSAIPAACGGVNKSGAPVHGSVALRLQMPDAGDPQGRLFAEALRRRSGGSIRITVDSRRYSNAMPSNELKLARALKAGTADIGYLPARAWAADGDATFKALLAPFAITTVAATQAVAAGPVGREVLAGLPHEVVGVGLVPAEPRRILANRPPDSAAALNGLRIRVIDNPQTAADLRALGARPVEGVRAEAVSAQIRAGRLDGAETSVTYALADGYFSAAPYLSGYAIVPKFQSIVLSRRVWDRLSDRQRAAVRAAAADALSEAAEQVAAQEAHDLAALCRARVRVVTPSAVELRELGDAAEAATKALESDPRALRVMGAMRAIAGSGPQASPSPLPAACRGAGTKQADAPARRGPATIPEGTYVVTDTRDDWEQGGVFNPELERSITFTTTFRAGRWYQTQKPNYPDQGPFSGTYQIHGDRVRIVMLKAGGEISAPETVTWSYFNRRLRFQNVDVADPGSRVLYAAHPWRKVR